MGQGPEPPWYVASNGYFGIDSDKKGSMTASR
jgi:hypothetical protein